MAARGGSALYSHSEEDCDMLLDPPDPVDLLLAHSKEGAGGPRPLDFVREKLSSLKEENARLRNRVQELEQTLSIVQTAHEWSVGKGMTAEQVDKMHEIKALLEQANKAKKDLANFSNSSRENLYEKLRTCKLALKKEREEKRAMKNRLAHAFDYCRTVKEQMRRLEEQQGYWQETVGRLQEKMRRTGGGGTGAGGAAGAGEGPTITEQVIGELSALQQHMQDVKQDTVDHVAFQDDSIFEDPSQDLPPEPDDLASSPP